MLYNADDVDGDNNDNVLYLYSIYPYFKVISFAKSLTACTGEHMQPEIV